MTLRNLRKSIGLLILFSILIFASCTSNDTIDETSTELTAEEAQNMILADDTSSEVDDILEDDENDVSLAGKGVANTSSAAPCADRTVEDTTDGKIVTLDFADGCTGRRGKVFAGKIIIEYVRTTDGFSKTVTFEDFSIDDNTVEGGKSIAKVNANASGNPEATYTTDVTITFTTGEIVVKKGTKVKEKIEGADTRDRGDDVYSISGSWEHTNKAGVVKTATITTNLIRTYACRYIVSGIIEITKDGEAFTLDFGDGSCDNLATLTDSTGTVEEITLRKK